MSAPRKIWVDASRIWHISGTHCFEGSEVYHHDDVVRELVEAANRLVNNPGWGTVNYTDGGMWADGEALRAALAKIAED